MNRKFSLASLGICGLIAAGNCIPHKAHVVQGLAPEHAVHESGALGDEVDRLAGKGYSVTGSDLAALTRVLYFEDAGDSKLHGDEEQRQGYAAIAEVIRNRYLFDTCNADAPVKNPSCGNDNPRVMYGGDKGLRGIIFKENKGVHQFSSLGDHPEWFTKDSLGRGLNARDSTGKVLDQHQLDLAYAALTAVFEGRTEDITNGALSYKNSAMSDAQNGKHITWHDQEVFGAVSTDCHELEHRSRLLAKALEGDKVTCRIERNFVHDYTKNIGTHAFYTVREDDRREIVHSDSCAFVNGKFNKKMSSGRYCTL
ncbi:hypothetical protein HZA98_03220 [Candidatus Woesearchaeota archaeon]|nr:hypothetical protein [Candidatus Woesearchaeota archaeon]